MSAWSRKRQGILAGIAFIMSILLVFGIYTFFFHKPSTCSDGVRNGIEEGIDCGGSCVRVCPFQTSEAQIVWARGFEISDGVYNLAAVVKNPNFDVQLVTQYKFEAFNEENLLIKELFGSATIPPLGTLPLFEPTILTGSQNIARVFLRLVGEPTWTRAQPIEQTVFVTDRTLSDTDSIPKLSVTLQNRGITPARDLAIFSVLYNIDGNVVQSSRTYVPFIERDSTREAFFTWPEAFTGDVTKIDVYITEAPLL